jgi:hypothetical protein
LFKQGFIHEYPHIHFSVVGFSEVFYFGQLKFETNYYLSDYSVGQFFEDARKATRSILDNGRVPIVVGGTGLYLRWYAFFITYFVNYKVQILSYIEAVSRICNMLIREHKE